MSQGFRVLGSQGFNVWCHFCLYDSVYWQCWGNLKVVLVMFAHSLTLLSDVNIFWRRSSWQAKDGEAWNCRRDCKSCPLSLFRWGGNILSLIPFLILHVHANYGHGILHHDHHALPGDHDDAPPVLLHHRGLPCHWWRLEHLSGAAAGASGNWSFWENLDPKINMSWPCLRLSWSSDSERICYWSWKSPPFDQCGHVFADLEISHVMRETEEYLSDCMFSDLPSLQVPESVVHSWLVLRTFRNVHDHKKQRCSVECVEMQCS